MNQQQQLQAFVDELRHQVKHVSSNLTSVSKVSKDLTDYVAKNMEHDPFIVRPSFNPFRDNKKSCAVL